MQSFRLISTELINPAKYANYKFLSHAFELLDPYLKQLKENLDTTIVIPRPNHGPAHTTRVAAYIPLVAMFLQKHGGYGWKFNKVYYENNMSEDKIICLQGAAFFSVVGRKDETGFSVSKEKQKIYRGYRQASADAFEEYCKAGFIPEEDIPFWKSIVLEMGNEPFYANDKKALQSQNDIFVIPDRPQDIGDMILHVSHCMDLFRCLPLHDTVNHDPFKILRGYCNNADQEEFKKDFIELMLFATNAIREMGDSLTSYMDVDGVIKAATHPDNTYKPVFCLYNTKPGLAIRKMNDMKLPDFYVKYLGINQQLQPQLQITHEIKPFLYYLKKANGIENADKTWYKLEFESPVDAAECLSIIKNLIKSVEPGIKDRKFSRYTLKETDKSYCFSLMIKEWIALRHELRKQYGLLKPSGDFYFKAILSVPGRNTFGPFTSELINPDLHLEKRHYKANFKVDGNKVSCRRKDIPTKCPLKQSQYTKEEKAEFTKFQSVSMGFDGYYSPAYGIKEDNAISLFIFEAKDVLLSNYLNVANAGSVNGPGEHKTESEAIEYSNSHVGITLFSKNDLSKYKNKLLASDKQNNCEPLARLKFNCDGSGKQGIPADTLRCRLVTAQYNASFAEKLKKSGKCDADYYPPIIFYTLADREQMFRVYTKEEYEMDCLIAKAFNADEKIISKCIAANEYEFLFGLEAEVIKTNYFQRKVDGIPFMLHLLSKGYVTVFKLLLEKTEQTFDEIWSQEFYDVISQQVWVSALYYVINSTDFELAEYLHSRIEFGKFDTKQEATDARSPLIAAIDKNNLAWVKRLVKYKWININALDVNGVHGKKYSALNLAVYRNREEMVEVLVAFGADIHASDVDGKKPLVHAVFNGSVDIANTLIEAGARYHVYNETPLTNWAAIYFHFDMIELLIKHDFDINLGDKNGITPLMHFVFSNSIKGIKLLLESGKVKPDHQGVFRIDYLKTYALDSSALCSGYEDNKSYKGDAADLAFVIGNYEATYVISKAMNENINAAITSYISKFNGSYEKIFKDFSSLSLKTILLDYHYRALLINIFLHSMELFASLIERAGLSLEEMMNKILSLIKKNDLLVHDVLQLAIDNKNVGAVRELLKHFKLNIFLKKMNIQKVTHAEILWLLAKNLVVNESYESLKSLLDQHPDISPMMKLDEKKNLFDYVVELNKNYAEDKGFMLLLNKVIMDGNIAAIELMLHRYNIKIDANEMHSEHGLSVFHYYMKERLNTQTANLLTGRVSNINCKSNHKDYKGFTALHFAIISKQVTNARNLLFCGASLYIKNDNGKTPINMILGNQYDISMISAFVDYAHSSPMHLINILLHCHENNIEIPREIFKKLVGEYSVLAPETQAHRIVEECKRMCESKNPEEQQKALYVLSLITGRETFEDKHIPENRSIFATFFRTVVNDHPLQSAEYHRGDQKTAICKATEFYEKCYRTRFLESQFALSMFNEKANPVTPIKMDDNHPQQNCIIS